MEVKPKVKKWTEENMEYKPKRYIIEMCNDFVKRYENAGKLESTRKINRIRNNYIRRMITEIDAIKSIITEEEN